MPTSRHNARSITLIVLLESQQSRLRSIETTRSRSYELIVNAPTGQVVQSLTRHACSAAKHKGLASTLAGIDPHVLYLSWSLSHNPPSHQHLRAGRTSTAFIERSCQWLISHIRPDPVGPSAASSNTSSGTMQSGTDSSNDAINGRVVVEQDAVGPAAAAVVLPATPTPCPNQESPHSNWWATRRNRRRPIGGGMKLRGGRRKNRRRSKRSRL